VSCHDPLSDDNASATVKRLLKVANPATRYPDAPFVVVEEVKTVGSI
jgi:hypothetical protein